MSDTPGWASPGSAPSSEGREPGAAGPAEPADRPGAAPAGPAGEATPTEPATPAAQQGAQWAAGQPPAGQWSAPTGAPGQGNTPPGGGWGTPPPGGPAGPGGPGGWGGYGAPGPGAWGGGWGGPPPAAKPGVIPLRPLGLGEILDGTVSTMRACWRTVLGVSLSVAVAIQLCLLLLQGFVMNDATTTFSDPGVTAAEAIRSLGEIAAGGSVVAVVSVIGSIIATALLTTVTSRAVLGRPVTIGEAWRDARPQLLRLLGLLALLGVISAGVLAVGALPGVLLGLATKFDGASIALLVLGVLTAAVALTWLTGRYSLASPALMLERQGVVKAMTRSAKLVRGSWWRVVGIQTLGGIIASVVSSIVALPFTLLGLAFGGKGMGSMFLTGAQSLSWTFLIITAIGAVIGSTISLPIHSGVTVLLYIDQRIRREALDLELARAAGVQDHGTGVVAGPVPGS